MAQEVMWMAPRESQIFHCQVMLQLFPTKATFGEIESETT